jgi:hypothetical protein
MLARGIPVVVAALTLAAPALASRPPTFREREALTAALPASFQREPVGCVWLDVRVSNDGRYAEVDPLFLNALHAPCVQYAANGRWILKKTTRWRIVFDGSDAPPCSLHVPKDLPGGCG